MSAPTPIVRKCDICWITDAATTRLLRFSLIRSESHPDGRHTTRGAGAVVLCEACWRKVAAPRMASARARARRAAAVESKRRLVKVGVPLEAVA